MKKLLPFLFLFATPLAAAQDWGQQVQSKLAAAGNQNVIVDMTALTGAQTSSVNPFANLASGASANVLIKIGCYNITTTVPWVIKASHVHIEGCTPQSQILAGSGFPAGPLITVGDNTFPIQDVAIEHVYLSCGDIAGCTAYVGNSLNEFNTLRHVNIANTAGASSAAVEINGTTQTMGHYILEDLQIVNVGTNDCIFIQANGDNQHRLRDITCNNSSGGKAGIHITASGTNETYAVVEHVHVEGFTDGVEFDNRVHGSIRDVDCTNGCSQAVHIANSCADVVVEGASVTTAATILKNDCSGHNVPKPSGGEIRTLTFYAQSNYAGNPAKAVYWNGSAWVIQ